MLQTKQNEKKCGWQKKFYRQTDREKTQGLEKTLQTDGQKKLGMDKMLQKDTQ